MPLPSWFVLSLSVLSVGLSQSVLAQSSIRTLGFDLPHVINYLPATYLRPQIREQGFVISVGSTTSPRGTYLQQGIYNYSPDNGSTYARFISGDENFKLAHEQGLLFTPVTLDLAGYNSVINVTVQGVKSDGSIVSHTFNQLSRGDGYGPGADFTTCTLPASFQQIRELRIPQTGYYLDNIVVEPPVGEVALPAPLPEPYLYDITWEAAPHVVGAMSATGGQRAPASVVFGNTVVRERTGGGGRYLELSKDNDTYDQIQMSLGVSARRYVCNFDMTQASGASTSFFLDLNDGFLRISLSDGTLNFYKDTELVTDGTGGSLIYTASASNQFEVVWDEATAQVSFSINGQTRKAWNIVDGSVSDIHTIRFSTSSTAVTAIDNVKIQALERMPLQIVPGDLLYFEIAPLTSQTVPIRVINRGSSSVTLSGVRPLAPAFTFSGLSFPVTVPAGGQVLGQMTAAPLTSSWKHTRLALDSDVGTVSARISTFSNSAATNYFSTHPATHTVAVGAPLQLVSVFSGPSVARFEWTKDSQIIAGTETTLDVSASASTTDSGVYQIKAYLTNGEVVTSNPATISVIKAGFTTQPASKWVQMPEGQTASLTLTSMFNLPVSRYEWTKDGSIIPATGASLAIASAKLQDAGVYRVTAYLADGSSFTSQPANVGVMIYSSVTRTVASGADFSQTCQVAGPSLTYVWIFNQTQPVSGLPGVVEAGQTLRLNPVTSAHQGSFACRAFMPDGAAPATSLSSATILSLGLQVQGGSLPVPVWQTTTLGHAMVGEPFQFTLSASSITSASFTASGLPAELTLVRETGRITGTPLASSIPSGTPFWSSRTYNVTVTAVNIYGQASRQVTLVLHPRWSNGKVIGLAQPGVLPGLRQVAKVQADISSSSLSLQTIGTPRVQATAALAFDPPSGYMKGTLRTMGPTVLSGHRIRWNGRFLESDETAPQTLFVFQAARVVKQLNPSYHVIGKYPTALTVEAGDGAVLPSLPVGSGVLSVKLSADARLTYTGTLPDGSSITGSGELVEDWENDQGLCHPLVCTTAGPGSLAGWLELGHNSLAGQLQWIRQPLRTHPTWPEGFELATLSQHIHVTGQRLVAPVSGDTLMGLHRQPVLLSGRTRDGMLEASRLFKVSNRHIATALPPATPAATLAVQAAEGTFSGSLSMGTYRGRSLTGTYRGVLLPSQDVGRGFMLVPDLARYEQSTLSRGITLSIGSVAPTVMPMKTVEIELTLERAE